MDTTLYGIQVLELLNCFFNVPQKYEHIKVELYKLAIGIALYPFPVNRVFAKTNSQTLYNLRKIKITTTLKSNNLRSMY